MRWWGELRGLDIGSEDNMTVDSLIPFAVSENEAGRVEWELGKFLQWTGEAKTKAKHQKITCDKMKPID